MLICLSNSSQWFWLEFILSWSGWIRNWLWELPIELDIIDDDVWMQFGWSLHIFCLFSIWLVFVRGVLFDINCCSLRWSNCICSTLLPRHFLLCRAWPRRHVRNWGLKGFSNRTSNCNVALAAFVQPLISLRWMLNFECACTSTCLHQFNTLLVGGHGHFRGHRALFLAERFLCLIAREHILDSHGWSWSRIIEHTVHCTHIQLACSSICLWLCIGNRCPHALALHDLTLPLLR